MSALAGLVLRATEMSDHGVATATNTTASSGGGCSLLAHDSGVSGLCASSHSLHIPVAYHTIAPVLVLGLGALLLLVVSSVLPKRSRPGLYAALTGLVGLVSLGTSIWQWVDIDHHGTAYAIGGQVTYDKFSVFFMMLVSVATVLAALMADSYLVRERLDGVEAYVLLLVCGAGAMLMALSAGLVMLFLGLEIMSMALYVLAAFHRRRAESGEAGLKYFILGSFSSAIFLYGVALVYGATGSTQFRDISSFLAQNILARNGVLLAGMALIIVGLGFKVAAVPFHFWTPDVYQGSPTPFVGYMAAVAKAGGFAGLVRVLVEALPSQQSNWRPIIWVLAVLTLLVGSVLAIVQKDLKRMFAYSSISQAGYVLIGLQSGSARGVAGMLFYLLTYTFIISGTFAVVGLIQGRGEARNDLGAIRGLARRRPGLALAMLVLLLAQAGIPPTSGFLGKFYVIEAAVAKGQYALAIIGMLAAAIAAFFYLRIGLLMYSGEGSEPGPPSEPAEATDGALTAGLKPVPTLDGPGATVGLLAPPDEAVKVPASVAVGLAICVGFTIFAGVAPAIIDLARQATLI